MGMPMHSLVSALGGKGKLNKSHTHALGVAHSESQSSGMKVV